ncbi:hypothetical protein FOCC_FOCC003206 [Frankliniella occidentalis]|nr:hypothetical protein FOCC_FOCC003206 [Frankliniella occidentalis]
MESDASLISTWNISNSEHASFLHYENEAIVNSPQFVAEGGAVCSKSDLDADHEVFSQDSAYRSKEGLTIESDVSSLSVLNVSKSFLLQECDVTSNSSLIVDKCDALLNSSDLEVLHDMCSQESNNRSKEELDMESETSFISSLNTSKRESSLHLHEFSADAMMIVDKCDALLNSSDLEVLHDMCSQESNNRSKEELDMESETSFISSLNTPKREGSLHLHEFSAAAMMGSAICSTSSPIPPDSSESEYDSDSVWDCSTSDLRVAFLDGEEAEENPDNPDAILNHPQSDDDDDGGGGGGGDSDHEPEDDHSSHGSSSSSDSDGEDFEDGPTFRFDHQSLATHVRFSRVTSVKEMLFMELAVSIDNNWTYKALLQHLRILNTSLNNKYFRGHTKSLWRRLLYTGNCMKSYAFCNSCGRGLGPRDQLPPVPQCICGFQAPRKKFKWFVSVSIKKQLEFILSLPGMGEHMQYRRNRQKLNPNNVEDIFDGQVFREMEGNEGFFSSEWNFGYVFFLDGFAEGKNARLEGWPILLRLVDLPPNMRQKYMILAGFWINKGYPNMKTFLKPFVRQAIHLFSVGINWRPNGNEVNSKFAPLCLCVDYKARPPILSQMQYNSAHGCFVCDLRGIYENGSWRYPALPHPLVPPGALRTDENVRQDMTTAKRTGRVVHGYYGKSELLRLRQFRICTGNAIDNLHAIFERVAPIHTNKLLRQGRMPIVEKERRINQRLTTCKPPNCIARTPYDFCKRGSYKANEWRNWVLHYSIPCLEDLGIPNRYLQHWQMLCYGVFLLSQDSIAPREIDIAEGLLNRYVQLYEEYFGLGAMTACVHLMSHLAVIVRAWGPLHAYTTFNFESYNRKLLCKIQSPKDAVKQVVTRHLLELCGRENIEYPPRKKWHVSKEKGMSVRLTRSTAEFY